MARKSKSVNYLEGTEIAPLTSVKCCKAMGEVCVELGNDGVQILDYMEAHSKMCATLYPQYLNAKTTKEATQYMNQMKADEEKAVEDILNVSGGWRPLSVAEKHKVKVNWQKMPFHLIDTKDCVDFLAGKGYDFEAQQTYLGQNVNFAEYHTSYLAYREKKTLDNYGKLLDTIQEHNKLVRSGKEKVAELNNPKTTEKRKAELDRILREEEKRYLKIKKELPQLCETVNEHMFHYFNHASVLKEAAAKGCLSPASLKEVDLKNLEESLMNMRAVYQKMEKANALFLQKQTNVNADEKQTLATATELNLSDGLKGKLGSAENTTPVREQTGLALALDSVEENGAKDASQKGLAVQQKYMENESENPKSVLAKSSKEIA